MLSSEDPSQLPNLPSLNRAFLTAFQLNDFSGLSHFNADLSQVVNKVQQASSFNSSSSDDKASLEILLFSHNSHVASSLAVEAQHGLDEIRNKFSEQIELLLSFQPTPSMPSTVPTPAVEDLSPENSSTSADPYTILKQWSLLHMSHLHPSKQQLDALATQTSMTSDQIKLWFRNARTRSGWAKLVAHSQINNEQARFEALLLQYQSLVDHRDSDIFKLSLSSDERLQLLDNVIRWFTPETGKQKKPLKPESIKPWVKEILNNAMDTLKTTSAGIIDSSRQFISSKKRARTSKNTPSSSPQPSTSAQHILRPSSQTSDLSMSPAPTTGSFSPAESLPFAGFPPYLGAVSDESSPRDPSQDFFSPASSSSSHPKYMEPYPLMAPISLPGSTSTSSNHPMDSPLPTPCSLPARISSSTYSSTEPSPLLDPCPLPNGSSSIPTSSPRCPTPKTPSVPPTPVPFHNGFDELLQLPVNPQSTSSLPPPVTESDGFDFSALTDNPIETSAILPDNPPTTRGTFDFLTVLPYNLPGTVGGSDFPTFPPDHLRNPPLAPSTSQPSFSNLNSFPYLPPGSNPNLPNHCCYNSRTQSGNNNGDI